MVPSLEDGKGGTEEANLRKAVVVVKGERYRWS